MSNMFRLTAVKPKKEEEPNKKEVKKEIEVVASIATKKIAAPIKIKARSTPVKTKNCAEVGTQDFSAITERWSEVKRKKV